MKKIIYSLVIMIAAGSLFTSCVENTEPQGIKDLRLAKADYLDALSNLRAADAEKVKAEAALVQAQAATEQARAALKQAYVKAKELANEAQKVQDEVAAAKAKADIDSIKAAAAKAAVVAQQGLAEAQAQLDSALRKITAQSFDLTQDEKKAISEATKNLNAAYNKYNAALNGYNFAAMQLWDAEYNVEAGVEGYETAESFKDSIAARESAIAQAKEHIATVEAIEEEPASVKEALDASAKKIEDLQEEIFLNEKSKTLYEAQVLAEANVEYNKRWTAFKADSIPAGTDYEFVEEDEDDNKVAVKYPLYGGRIDKYFRDLVNDVFPVKKACDYGIKVDADAENIEVGKIGTVIATEEQLDTAQAIVAAIVSALNRDLVVVNDPQDSANAAEAVKAAEEADSIYVAHRDILEKGLKEFQPYKDSLEDFAALVQDTVDFKADSLAPAKEAADLAKEKVSSDTAAIKDALKAAAADYIKANKDFATVVNAIRHHQRNGNFTAEDSSDFIAAVKKLGEAQAAYLGEQDTIHQYSLKSDLTIKEDVVKISDLTPEGFVAVETDKGTNDFKATSLYGGNGYGAFANQDLITEYKVKAHYIWNNNIQGPDAFARIIRRVTGKTTWDWTSDITVGDVAFPAQVGETYDPTSPIAYKPVTDTVKWGSIVAKGIKAPYEALVADKAESDSLSNVATAVQTKFDEKVAKVTNYNGLKNAQVELVNIYASFSGITEGQVPAGDTATINKGVKFNWTEATFEDPFTCVWVVGNHVHYTATAEAILGRVTNSDVPSASGLTKSKTIFEGPNGLTEYAKKFQTAFAAYVAQNYTEAEEQLKNINEQFEAIVADLAEYAEEVAEAKEAANEVLARFLGVNEDGDLLSEVPRITAACVTDGKWNLGGYQKEWAEELAEAYPAIVKAAQCGELYGQIGREINFKYQLDIIYTQWFNQFAEQEEIGFAWNVEQIIEKLEDIIEDEEGKIESLEADIEGFKKAVAACEAGYSPAKAKVDFLKTILEQKEVALEQAEFALDQAKKVYNAVIENYK